MADIITVNLKKPHLAPIYDVYSHLVYAAMASDVETVMVNGKVVVNDVRLTTGNEEDILHKALEWGKKIAAYNSQH